MKSFLKVFKIDSGQKGFNCGKPVHTFISYVSGQKYELACLLTSLIIKQVLGIDHPVIKNYDDTIIKRENRIRKFNKWIFFIAQIVKLTIPRIRYKKFKAKFAFR